jgi:hypothetical protein
MKNIIFILAIVLSNTVNAQTKFADHAQPTFTKDTLYLLCDDPMSIQTYKIWLHDPTWKGVNPVINWVDPKQMKLIKVMYAANCKRKDEPILNNFILINTNGYGSN